MANSGKARTLVTALPEERGWSSVLDLKDAGLGIPLERRSQLLFAFQGQDPDTWVTEQHRWTVLPRG